MPTGHPVDLRPKLRQLIQIAQKRGDTILPSALELSRRWGSVPRTVNRAVTRLIAEGYLLRRGKKLHIVKSSDRRPGLEEPPFRIHVVAPGSPKWLQKQFEKCNCNAVFHVWTDPTQSWKLLQKTQDTTCEGVSLFLEQEVEPPPWAEHIIQSLIKRRIPVVCNPHIGQGNYVLADLFKDPTIMRRLAELGHQHVLVPYSSNLQKRLVPEFFNQHGYQSYFNKYSIKATYEQLGCSPTMRQLCNILARHVRGRNGVTAVYCFEQETVMRCCEAAHNLGIQIPAGLSVVYAAETSGPFPGKLPVSSWWLNNQSGNMIAIDLLVNQIREVRASGRMPGPEIIRVEPFFFDQGTLGPARKTHTNKKESAAEEFRNKRWLSDPDARIQQITAINTKPYPSAGRIQAGDWIPLELDGIFNRHLGREHGWLGDIPLLHMPRGRQFIHGVPFWIAGDHYSKKPDCVVLRSCHAHTGKGRQLPVMVKLKIERKAHAVYFLHGCGWTGNQKPFASYEFQYKDGAVEVIQLEPFKGGDSSPFSKRPQTCGNIHDWWPTPLVPQFQSAHARLYVVTDGGDPFLYERYLHSLEWINPHPDKKIRYLMIRSDPQAEATLGVLAITMRP